MNTILLSVTFESFMAYLSVAIVIFFLIIALYGLHLYNKSDDDTSWSLFQKNIHIHFHLDNKDKDDNSSSTSD